MNIFSSIYGAVLYQPIANILVLLYILTGSFGFAIIILTLAVKAVLHPLNRKSLESQKAMTKIQPKLKEIQKQYKDSPEKQTKEIMKLYKEEKFNPFAGFLILFIQLPFLVALFQVFQNGADLAKIGPAMYSFVHLPQSIEPMFLNILDLTRPNIILAVLTAAAQFLQIKTATPPVPAPKEGEEKDSMDQMSQMMQKQMVFIFPVITFIVLFKLPSALALYWIVSTIVSIFEQKLLFSEKKEKNEIK
ncbi:MAG: YidC/Oxa1 family membrane protein insertase [Candidatus Paceibacterota bacterium]